MPLLMPSADHAESGGAWLMRIGLLVGEGALFLTADWAWQSGSFPWLLHTVARSRSRELFTLTVFGMCIGVAFLGALLDMSLALGAFVAGLARERVDLQAPHPRGRAAVEGPVPHALLRFRGPAHRDACGACSTGRASSASPRRSWRARRCSFSGSRAAGSALAECRAGVRVPFEHGGVFRRPAAASQCRPGARRRISSRPCSQAAPSPWGWCRC